MPWTCAASFPEQNLAIAAFISRVRRNSPTPNVSPVGKSVRVWFSSLFLLALCGNFYTSLCVCACVKTVFCAKAFCILCRTQLLKMQNGCAEYKACAPYVIPTPLNQCCFYWWWWGCRFVHSYAGVETHLIAVHIPPHNLCHVLARQSSNPQHGQIVQ